MIKAQLEEYNLLGYEIQACKDMLNSRIVKNYSYLNGIKNYSRVVLDHINQLEQRRRRVIDLIEAIEDPIIRKIFTMKYIDQESHDTICWEVAYSYTYLSKLIKMELEKMEA